MSFVSGTAGSVAFVSGGTTILAKAHQWSIDISQAAPDVTAFGDSFKNFIGGIREWKATAGIRVDPAQASQDAARNMILNGSAAIEFRFYLGTNYYSGSAFPTSAKPEIAYDGAAMNSYDLQGTGSLGYT